VYSKIPSSFRTLSSGLYVRLGSVYMAPTKHLSQTTNIREILDGNTRNTRGIMQSIEEIQTLLSISNFLHTIGFDSRKIFVFLRALEKGMTFSHAMQIAQELDYTQNESIKSKEYIEGALKGEKPKMIHEIYWEMKDKGL
jgi:hypothetical protein